MTATFRICAFLLPPLLALAALPARASCGAAFCLVNTDWTTQGAWTEPGARLDLRHEFIDLDQPRHGRRRIGVGEVSAHHDEIETRNRNWVATVDWNLAPQWGVSIVLPYVDRDHEHIHNHRGERLLESWEFRGVGDVRVLGRYDFASAAPTDATHASAWGVTLGVKLPTGDYKVANGEGARAERSLQPGTGTTDVVAGVHVHGASIHGWSWFARAQAQVAANTKAGYKPGEQLQLDVGARYALTDAVAALLQANFLAKGRDSGSEAEPESSGQRALFVSPGVSVNLSRAAQLYAFVQFPAWQRVNGVQLTADWSALAGVSLRF